jgi:hypothetical protein
VLTQPLILVVARANLSLYQLVAVSLSRLPLGSPFPPAFFSFSTTILVSNFARRSTRFASAIIALLTPPSETSYTIVESQVSPELLLSQDSVHVFYAVVFVLHESLQRDWSQATRQTISYPLAIEESS